MVTAKVFHQTILSLLVACQIGFLPCGFCLAEQNSNQAIIDLSLEELLNLRITSFSKPQGKLGGTPSSTASPSKNKVIGLNQIGRNKRSPNDSVTSTTERRNRNH